MTLGEMIYQYRMDHHLSQRAFAQKCGVSNVYINMLEKNMNPSTGKPIVPSAIQLKAMADAMGYTLDEVMRTVDPESVVTVQSSNPKQTSAFRDVIRKRRTLFSGNAGIGKTATVSDLVWNIFDQRKDRTIIEIDLVVDVDDNEMYPTYQKNDIVYVKERPDIKFDGEVMAVMIDEKTTLIRHVYQITDGLRLLGDNPDYPPDVKLYSDYPNMRIIGEVCGFTRLYNYRGWGKRE